MNVLSICTTHLNIHNSSTRSHSSEEENSVSMHAFSNLVNVSILVNLNRLLLFWLRFDWATQDQQIGKQLHSHYD